MKEILPALDYSSEEPLYHQLYRYIKSEMIETGRLGPDESCLP